MGPGVSVVRYITSKPNDVFDNEGSTPSSLFIVTCHSAERKASFGGGGLADHPSQRGRVSLKKEAACDW